jgi:NarL family two-component system response regulator LiaR
MITISIVEDHPGYMDLLVKTLQENKLFQVKSIYTTADEAIEGLVKNPTDIAIIDLKLHQKSGIEVIQKTKAHLKTTQFLVCSSYQNDENIFNALKAGASGYITKGSTVNEIQNAVIELFNGGSPMSPFIARKVIGLLQEEKYDTNNYGLSERELEVLSLLSQGLLYKEISDRLNISANTVKNHCKNIYKRLHVQNKVEALNKFSNYNFQPYLSLSVA